MDPWHVPVDQARALRLICPLPDGHVTGVQQVARRGDTVVIATLTQTIRHDTWGGLRVTVKSPATGESNNWFGFAEHKVFNESVYPADLRDGTLSRLNQGDLLRVDRIRAGALRDAVEDYTAVFAAQADPEFLASARLEGLFGLAQRLDHLSSAHPDVLAGRAEAHAEVLRETAFAIRDDLLPLAGERRAADGEQFGLGKGLPNLAKLRGHLETLATGADEAEHPELAERFRGHAAALGYIADRIRSDYATSAAQAGERFAAARSAGQALTPPADATAAATRRADGQSPPITRGRR